MSAQQVKESAIRGIKKRNPPLAAFVFNQSYLYCADQFCSSQKAEFIKELKPILWHYSLGWPISVNFCTACKRFRCSHKLTVTLRSLKTALTVRSPTILPCREGFVRSNMQPPTIFFACEGESSRLLWLKWPRRWHDSCEASSVSDWAFWCYLMLKATLHRSHDLFRNLGTFFLIQQQNSQFLSASGGWLGGVKWNEQQQI